MKISVNNQIMQVDDGTTVAALVRQQNINRHAIAVAVNQHIIHRENWADYQFHNDDSVVVVTVVAGG
ncbi:sulfur carrier protein ThiS [Alteromonas sp. H39]|uniref:sulfur carrier protein ThiS n=1 Tax=Alteromonas sp. H39 TaxID=3389876 RepID=UPI0039DFF90E